MNAKRLCVRQVFVCENASDIFCHRKREGLQWVQRPSLLEMKKFLQKVGGDRRGGMCVSVTSWFRNQLDWKYELSTLYIDSSVLSIPWLFAFHHTEKDNCGDNDTSNENSCMWQHNYFFKKAPSARIDGTQRPTKRPWSVWPIDQRYTASPKESAAPNNMYVFIICYVLNNMLFDYRYSITPE